MVVAGIIAFIIIAIIAVRMIATAINSRSQRAMAEEETKGYTMVDSTELGEDGKPLQVPVPDGFTASQVPGETTVNGGFVIYEGDVDWSKIEDLDSYAEVDTQAEETDSSTENSDLTDNANTDVTSTGSNSSDDTINSDSTTTNERNSEEVVQEEQTQDANSDQADLPENSQENLQENVISEENEMTQEQIDEENVQVQEEIIDTEQTDNTEENAEEIEQANNEVINEEEPITNEGAGVATMSEEGDTGIATLAEGETPTTVFDLQTSTNQYVWVPVKDVSRIYGIDNKGKIWGKLYDYSSSGRSNLNWSENSTSGVMSISRKTNYREPDVVTGYGGDSFDGDAKIQSYRDGIEQYQMLSQDMEENYYKMIESVKKYGGFYIGRYETGDLGKEEAVVKKMNTDINDQTWYVMYEKCKKLEGEKANVETSMIWGSLWDETLQWLVDSDAKISTGETIDYTLINNSTNWGNYSNATFEYRTTNGGTSTKSENSMTKIPTGSAEYTKANNIYDLAGNVCDWTLEADNYRLRVSRGGRCNINGISDPVRYRDAYYPSSSVYYYGCRGILYVK